MRVNHAQLFVRNVATAADEFRRLYGFAVVGEHITYDQHSVAIRQGRITLVLTEGLVDEHPASLYVQMHGDSVADIAVRVDDVAAAVATVVAAGARLIVAEHESVGRIGWKSATVEGFGDVTHTLIQAPATAPDGWLPPPFALLPSNATVATTVELGTMDHFAVCLEAGDLQPTVDFYCAAFGMQMVFEERIVVGPQAMLSQVVQGGDLILTLIEPDPETEPGQIADFVKNHGGAGVQHIAFTTPDIVAAVRLLRDNGVDFLATPRAYYTALAERFAVTLHDVAALQALSILVDQDQDGQLFQIFARSTHPRNTLFFEVIERAGARHFGSGNIKALYEAVERGRSAATVELP